MTDQKTCERPDCENGGRTYYKFGRSVSTGPFNWCSSGPAPEHPIALCADHALAVFGVALTRLPGDAA